MGILKDEYERADFGNELNGGYGFSSFEDALLTMDDENDPFEATYKITGKTYLYIGKNKFIEMEARK